jgi:molybdate transport system substrate-binding protein
MNARSLFVLATTGFMLPLLIGAQARAAEVKVLAALAMQPVLADLGPKFERTTGHKLVVTFATLGGIVNLVQDGASGDVLLVPQAGIERLTKDGKVMIGSAAVIARSGSGIAVRTGAPKPDISSPDALKRTLLAARSVSHSDPGGGGASGIHFAKVLDRLGIADEMKAKTVLPKPGSLPGQTVANGEAEIGVGTVQGLITIAGIEIVGPLPIELQDTLVFVAANMISTKQLEAGKAFIDFLRSPEAVAGIKAMGMEAGAP